MGRNPNALLSGSEFSSLVRTSRDEGRHVSKKHASLLVSMGLVIQSGENLVITDAGRHRLVKGGETSPLVVGASL